MWVPGKMPSCVAGVVVLLGSAVGCTTSEAVGGTFRVNDEGCAWLDQGDDAVPFSLPSGYRVGSEDGVVANRDGTVVAEEGDEITAGRSLVPLRTAECQLPGDTLHLNSELMVNGEPVEE